MLRCLRAKTACSRGCFLLLMVSLRFGVPATLPSQSLATPGNPITPDNVVDLVKYTASYTTSGPDVRVWSIISDPSTRSGAEILALYVELRIVPLAMAALQLLPGPEAAARWTPVGSSAANALGTWPQHNVPLGAFTLAIAEICTWAGRAAANVLQLQLAAGAGGQPVQPAQCARKLALLVLQQLSHRDLWRALADILPELVSSGCLLLPASSSSSPAVGEASEASTSSGSTRQ